VLWQLTDLPADKMLRDARMSPSVGRVAAS
jgi:hypothetical protein